MEQSYQFSGLLRRQFSILVILALIVGLGIGSCVLFALLDYFTFKLGFNAHSAKWLTPVLFGSVFVTSILTASIFTKYISRFMRKTWNIKLNKYEIAIHQSGQEKKTFLISQLERFEVLKAKSLLGFNESIQFKFGEEKIDIQIVISPILSSSTKADQKQFLQFIEYIYNQFLSSQFHLTNKDDISAKILTLFIDRNLIHDKYVFERKSSIIG